MERDILFQQAEDAQETARRLVREAREQARKAREQQKRRMRRSDQPLLWFSNEDE